jgi:hypothetical protein
MGRTGIVYKKSKRIFKRRLGKIKMKILISIIVKTVILLITLELQAQKTNSDKRNNDTLYNAKSKIIKVPAGKGKQVVTDGIFSTGEWDDALSYSVADNYNIYLKADSEILYIGLKSAEPIGECISEIRITSNEKDVFLLHVSGCLGEGVSGFPATTKFDLNNNQYWAANFLSADSLKKAAWLAAGQSVETYEDMYKKRDGIEFKIYRKKFTGSSLKFTIGWIQIGVKGNEYNKNIYNYPESATLRNADNWVELILPATEN